LGSYSLNQSCYHMDRNSIIVYQNWEEPEVGFLSFIGSINRIRYF
jgi:hypothetical protein